MLANRAIAAGVAWCKVRPGRKTMSSNTVLYGWRRAHPGREQLSAVHFQEFVDYLTGLRNDGQIASFEPVLLDPNGSGLIGFFLIRGEDAKLNAVLSSEAWLEHIVRSMFHLDGPVLVRGAMGDLVEARMRTWSSYIPP
jgi:hypothetical protein